ncbi:glutathione S-transferase family protein [Neptunomonas japonica]|uniref:Glutathione S-transferase n=1 Tax=Neptunomonas japonica JAMM 1380 TaxID=1441457 RepID=A0A7R6PBD7_9GAMM|nr:glutathione S-transferase family protein [Neptunomonas japonica]BBB30663.1 glutathione S-transferase [Neptunomonas japonica JAMM 1380]
MLKVYGSVLSRAGMVMVTLETLGLEYELISIGTRSEASQSAEYRQINPTGKVPTLQDGDFVLFETQAILYYLVRKYGEGRLWADSPETEADILRWSLFISNQLEACALDMLLQFKGVLQDASAFDKANATLERFLPVLEAQLEGKEYLVGDKTIADIHGAMVLSWPKLAGFDYALYPNVAAWVRRILSSPENKKVATAARM